MRGHWLLLLQCNLLRWHVVQLALFVHVLLLQLLHYQVLQCHCVLLQCSLLLPQRTLLLLPLAKYFSQMTENLWLPCLFLHWLLLLLLLLLPWGWA